MKKCLIGILILLSLSGCIRRMNIEQGNVLTPELVAQIHPGMSEEQVKGVLGTPVLLNTFNDNRVDYVYTFKPGNGKMDEKYITLIFRNHRLQSINGNMYSAYMRS